MCLVDSSAWEKFLDYVSEFSDSRLIDEIDCLEKAIDSDFMNDSILFDCVSLLYDFCRDECVRRVASRCDG